MNRNLFGGNNQVCCTCHYLFTLRNTVRHTLVHRTRRSNCCMGGTPASPCAHPKHCSGCARSGPRKVMPCQSECHLISLIASALRSRFAACTSPGLTPVKLQEYKFRTVCRPCCSCQTGPIQSRPARLLLEVYRLQTAAHAWTGLGPRPWHARLNRSDQRPCSAGMVHCPSVQHGNRLIHNESLCDCWSFYDVFTCLRSCHFMTRKTRGT